MTRPLLGAIKVLELSFDDWDKLATQYVIIDNISRLRVPAEGLKYLLKYLGSPKCLNLKDSVLQSKSTYDYVKEREILETVLAISDIRRLEFKRKVNFMLSGLVKTGTIYAFLKSLIFARCNISGSLTGMPRPCRCPNLRFLIVDLEDISDNLIVIKAAIDNCLEYEMDNDCLWIGREVI